jgi:hypothetical protein
MIGSSLLVIVSLALASILPAIRASRLQIAEALGSCLGSTAYCAHFCCLSRRLSACLRARLPRRNPRRRSLLKRSDSYRNGWPSYVLRVKITQLRIRQGGRGETLRGLAEGNGEDLRRVSESARKRPAPADAGRRYVGLSARHQPPGAHHAARAAQRRRLQRRRGPHQLRRRLHAVYLRTEKVGARTATFSN